MRLNIDSPSIPYVQEMGERDTCLGWVLYIRIATHDYRQLSWPEVWETFTHSYPGRWALQWFPPEQDCVDEVNIYHLYVLEPGFEPRGMNIHPSRWGA